MNELRFRFYPQQIMIMGHLRLRSGSYAHTDDDRYDNDMGERCAATAMPGQVGPLTDQLLLYDVVARSITSTTYYEYEPHPPEQFGDLRP